MTDEERIAKARSTASPTATPCPSARVPTAKQPTIESKPMPTRLFHLLSRETGEHVRVINGEGERAYPTAVLFNPDPGWQWPPSYLFRPKRGDVLETTEAREGLHDDIYRVPYIGDDMVLHARVRRRDTIEITAETANAQALHIMRLRMRDWFNLRAEWAHTHAIDTEYSRTSMAADVAPWLELDQAMNLCEKAGWP